MKRPDKRIAHMRNIAPEFKEAREVADWIDHLESKVAVLCAELTEIKEIHRTVMEEKCPTDEVHCACVPILRAQRDALEKEIKDLANASIEISHKYSAELEVLREIVRNALAIGVAEPAKRMLEKALGRKL